MSSSSPHPALACRACGAAGADKKCTQCHLARYCSAACQRRDWAFEHKKTCTRTPSHVVSAYSDNPGMHLVAREAVQRGQVLLHERPLAATSRLVTMRKGVAVTRLAGAQATPGGATGSWRTRLAQVLLCHLDDLVPDDDSSDDEADDVEDREANPTEHDLAVRAWTARYAQCTHDMPAAHVALYARLHRLSRSTIERVARVVAANANVIECPMTRLAAGDAFYAYASYANHACQPNAIALYEGVDVRLVALADIEAGAEVRVSYLGNTRVLNGDVRVDALRTARGFECECSACMVRAESWYAVRAPDAPSEAAPPAAPLAGKRGRAGVTTAEAERAAVDESTFELHVAADIATRAFARQYYAEASAALEPVITNASLDAGRAEAPQTAYLAALYLAAVVGTSTRIDHDKSPIDGEACNVRVWNDTAVAARINVDVVERAARIVETSLGRDEDARGWAGEAQERALAIVARIVALDATDAPEAAIDALLDRLRAHLDAYYGGAESLLVGEAPLIFGVHRVRALLAN